MSAMRKAAAPITGGTICPPVLFIASIPPATAPLNPVAFISGMLMTPSTITLAGDDPRAGDDGHLGRSPATRAGDAQAQIDDELPNVAGFEEGAEQDEQVDVARG